jgi:hypothetical protein
MHVLERGEASASGWRYSRKADFREVRLRGGLQVAVVFQMSEIAFVTTVARV